MKATKTLIAAAALAVTTGVLAAPVVNTNVRPVTVNPTPWLNETDLQDVVDIRFGAGVVDVNTDQNTAGTWGSATGVPASTIPTLVIEQTSGDNNQTFGIWFGNDSSNLLQIDLFTGSAFASGGLASAAALVMNYGWLEIFGSSNPASPSTCYSPLTGGEVQCQYVQDTRINPMNFGFYFKTPSLTAYSIDSLNAPGVGTRFLAFDDNMTNWLFAFEDGNDFDYQDMVVKVESIKVPEPGSIALLGLGLAGLAAASRRKQKQA